MGHIKNIRFDISVCITLHRENKLAYRTLTNVASQISYAQAHDVTIEVLLHLDRPDSATRKLVKDFSDFLCKTRIYENSFGDPGVSRNFLIEKVNGKYIAFIDADDYFTHNWLWLAWQRAKRIKYPSVFSPEKCIYFNNDGIKMIQHILHSKDPNFCRADAIVCNPILSANFVHNEIYKNIKYRPNSKHFGYEDWRWNLDILAAGYNIITVPKAIFFYRLKEIGSVNLDSKQEYKTVGRSTFFDPSVFIKLNIPNKSKFLSSHSVSDIQENSIRVANTRTNSIKKRSLFTSPKLFTKRFIINRYGIESYSYRLCKDSYNFIRTLFSVPAFTLLENLGLRDVQKNYSYTTDSNSSPYGQLSYLFNENELNSYNEIASLEPQLKPMLYETFTIEDIFQSHSVTNIYANICRAFNGNVKQIYIVDKLDVESEEYSMILQLLSKNQNNLILVLSEVETKVRNSLENSDTNSYLFDNLINLSSIDHSSMLIMTLLDNWEKIRVLHCFPGEFAFDVIQKYNSHILKNHKVKWHIGEDILNSTVFGKVSSVIEDRHSVSTEKEKVSHILLNKYGIDNILVTKPYKRKNVKKYKKNLNISKPETTVIMPVYNADEFLEPAIESILQQTYNKFEFLIINDGSTDNSQKIIDKYAALDKRIRVINQNNKGLVTTLNQVIRSVKTTYIARMDADDISKPERLEKQISYLKSHSNIGVVGCLTQNITYSNDLLNINVRPSSPSCLAYMTGGYCQLAGPSIVAVRDCLLEAGLFRSSEYPAEDYGLWTRIVLQKKYSLFLIPEVLYYYRINRSGISKTQQTDQLNKTTYIGNYYRCRSILNGNSFSDSTIFHQWISDADKMPDNITRSELINEYIQIAYSYIADEYKLNRSQAAHSINKFEHNIKNTLGDERAQEFKNNIMMLLTGELPYSANKLSFVPTENSKITVLVLAQDIQAKLQNIEKLKMLKNAKIIILCDDMTKPFATWSKLNIVFIKVPFTDNLESKTINYGLSFVQTPYVFFFNKLFKQDNDFTTMYQAFVDEKLDVVTYKNKVRKSKKDKKSDNFLAHTCFLQLLLGSNTKYQKLSIHDIFSQANHDKYGILKINL